MKKAIDKRWNIEYLYDDKTGKIYKELICFHNNGSRTIDKFEYEFIERLFYITNSINQC